MHKCARNSINRRKWCDLGWHSSVVSCVLIQVKQFIEKCDQSIFCLHINFNTSLVVVSEWPLPYSPGNNDQSALRLLRKESQFSTRPQKFYNDTQTLEWVRGDITKISKSALPGKIASGYSCIMLTRLRAESPVSTYHLEALRLKRAWFFFRQSY